MKNSHLKICLPFALLTSSFILADETLSPSTDTEQKEVINNSEQGPDCSYQPLQILPIEQSQLKNNARIGLDLDLFWVKNKYHIQLPIYDENKTVTGSYWARGHDINQYEGARLTLEQIKPNAIYLGSTVWGALGVNHRKWYVNNEKIEDKESGSNVWFNMDCGFGYNFQPASSSHFLLSVFVGPGYHFERRFKRDAEWGYNMVGIKMNQNFSKDVSVGMNFKTMYSYNLRDRDGITSFERNQANHFWGIEFELPFTWHMDMAQKYDLQFKPYFLKFNLNSPETILGARLGLGISF